MVAIGYNGTLGCGPNTSDKVIFNWFYQNKQTFHSGYSVFFFSFAFDLRHSWHSKHICPMSGLWQNAILFISRSFDLEFLLEISTRWQCKWSSHLNIDYKCPYSYGYLSIRFSNTVRTNEHRIFIIELKIVQRYISITTTICSYRTWRIAAKSLFICRRFINFFHFTVVFLWFNNTSRANEKTNGILSACYKYWNNVFWVCCMKILRIKRIFWHFIATLWCYT